MTREEMAATKAAAFELFKQQLEEACPRGAVQQFRANLDLLCGRKSQAESVETDADRVTLQAALEEARRKRNAADHS